MNKAMQCKHIADDHVIDLAAKWLADPITNDGVVAALVAEGWPLKLAETKVLHLSGRGLLDWGTTPRYAWPTNEGRLILMQSKINALALLLRC